MLAIQARAKALLLEGKTIRNWNDDETSVSKQFTMPVADVLVLFSLATGNGVRGVVASVNTVAGTITLTANLGIALAPGDTVLRSDPGGGGEEGRECAHRVRGQRRAGTGRTRRHRGVPHQSRCR